MSRLPYIECGMLILGGSLFDSFFPKLTVVGRAKWLARSTQCVETTSLGEDTRTASIDGVYAIKRHVGRILAALMSIALGLG